MLRLLLGLRLGRPPRLSFPVFLAAEDGAVLLGEDARALIEE